MSELSPVRCAVVGVGYLGRFHAQKHQQIENAQLVAVCDAVESTAKAVSEELRVPYETDYKKLLGKVDAVTVASSTSSHFEVAHFFLENGVHVQVEKPLTESSEQGRILCQLAKKNNLCLQVGHVERFNTALVEARKRITNPLFIECHRLAPFKMRSAEVDVVLDLMIHDIDVMMSLVKSKVVNIAAVGTPVLTKLTDIANVRFEFESGAVANITASRVSQVANRKFRLFQEDQYLSIDFGSGEVQLISKEHNWAGVGSPLKTEIWNLQKSDALLEETKSFVHSIQTHSPCVVTGEDGLLAVELAEQVMQLIKSRQKRG